MASCKNDFLCTLCSSSHAARVIQNGGEMGLEVGITACLGEKFWLLWHTSSNGGRLVNRQKPCRSVYLLHFPSACKLFHINIPLFIFLSVRVSTWTMLQKKREKPCLWSIGCAPEGDVFARMSVGTSSKLLSNFAESLKTQDNKDDEDRGKNMYLESLAPGTVWNFEGGSYAHVCQLSTYCGQWEKKGANLNWKRRTKPHFKWPQSQIQLSPFYSQCA